MGRPLNKKYFGNRNIGTGGDQTIGTLSNSQNYADDRIGGSALGLYTLNVQQGSIEVDSDSGQPVLSIPAPTLPDGVQATATVVWEVESITITGTNDFGTGYVNGETVTFTGATGVTATVAVAADDIGVITPVLRGSFTTIPTSETYAVIGAVGNDAQAEIKWRVKSITTLQKGSGYVAAPTITWVAGVAGPISGTAPGAPTVALLADTGAVGSATNQENAIRMTAFLPSGSAGEVDIIRQVSTNRYKVTDGTRTGIVQLQTTLANAAGEGSIAATDSAGGEYFVTKLTGRKATVTRAGGSGWLYATGQAAPWKFDAAAGIYLQIANA
jgi:hypothetical protein